MLERELQQRIRSMPTRELWETNDRANFLLTHAPISHSNFVERVIQLSGQELMRRTVSDQGKGCSTL